MMDKIVLISFVILFSLFVLALDLWMSEVEGRKFKEHAVETACNKNKLPSEFCSAYKGEEHASKKSKGRL